MTRREKPEEPGPSKAYLISFGDTMTTLLAFFIVLCSLADDQTGANLHSGTGSFVRSVNGFGLPGVHTGERSERTFQMEKTGPLYLAQSEDQSPADKDPSGPDEQDNQIRSIHREEEQFKRFLNEMQRRFELQVEPSTTGEVTFDFFEPLNLAAPVLPDEYDEVLAQVVPLLRRDTHRIDAVVWLTTPAPSAWRRAARQASQVAAELKSAASLPDKSRHRLRVTARPWMYKDAKRPVLSISIRRVQ